MAYTRSADVLIMNEGKPLAGQTEASFEASNEFEEFIDRVATSQGNSMTSRELTGQDFTVDLTAMVNMSDKSDTSVFKILWNAWKAASDLQIKLAVKKANYAPGTPSSTDDLIEATMKIETLSGDFGDGLASLEIALAVNGSVEYIGAEPLVKKA